MENWEPKEIINFDEDCEPIDGRMLRFYERGGNETRDLGFVVALEAKQTVKNPR